MLNGIVNILVSRKIINKEDREIYEYGLKMGTMYIVYFLCAFLCAIFLEEIIPFFFALAVFIMLRRNAGGYHARTVYGCFFLSEIYMLGVLLFVKWIRYVGNQTLIILLWIYSLLFLLETIAVKGIGTKKRVGKVNEKYLLRTYKKIMLINVLVVVSFFLKLDFIIIIAIYSFFAEGIALRMKNYTF